MGLTPDSGYRACMPRAHSFDWRPLVGWVCECDLYSDLSLTGSSHHLCMIGWFLYEVLRGTVIVDVAVWFFSAYSGFLLPSKIPYGEVEAGGVANDENLRRLPGTAGLLLINHHGEHLHRQISTSERSSEGPVTPPSHRVWNEMGWNDPAGLLMHRDSLHFLSQNNSICCEATLELAVWMKTSETTSSPFKIK